MNLREWLGAHRIAGLIGALALIFIPPATAYLMWPHGQTVITPEKAEAFYSIDNGKTWFADKALKLPPFDYEGSTAVGVELFEASGKQFIGYLERYTPEGKERISEFRDRQAAGKVSPIDPGPYLWVQRNGREVKRPGDTNWLPASDPEAQRIMHPQSSDGSPAFPVLPQSP